MTALCTTCNHYEAATEHERLEQAAAAHERARRYLPDRTLNHVRRLRVVEHHATDVYDWQAE